MLLCFTAKSQDVPKHLMSTNKFEYNGWKIKKGNVINLANNDSFIIEKMDWYSLDGFNVLYVSTKLKGIDTSIDFDEWVQSDLIIRPKGIEKRHPDIPDTAIKFTDVIKVDGVSASELYSRSKIWFASTYRNSNAVIQMDSKEETIIIGKANIIYKTAIFAGSLALDGVVNYIIKISSKDGRYKYELSDFSHEATSITPYRRYSFGLITSRETCPINIPALWHLDDKAWREIKKTVSINSTDIIESLKIGMLKPSKEDNW